MDTGEVVDGRFEIASVAGRGGMGVVYRAVDQLSGRVVALKVLVDAERDDLVTRFAHEAKLLGALDHPNIVRYVTHGFASKGEPYLVMEWLEGTSLAERLLQQRLAVGETIEVTRAVASALAAAHAHGIIHRDIKPSNIFLQHGSIASVKLLDFGIARLEHATTGLTGTGTILGTPGYMAPEQARGDKAPLDARADIFSLGCVLYECLTGKPAFQAVHLMALLAKLLMEDVPRVRSQVPGVPGFLDELCAQMLSKDPFFRPSSGSAVVAAINDARHDGESLPPLPAPALTDTEKRLVSVIAIAATETDTDGTSPDSTCLSTVSRELLRKVRNVLQPFGANVEELVNGTLVVLLLGSGPATDQAAVAAQCALRLQQLLPLSPIVLLTGRGVSTERLPVGDVLESAASLLDDITTQWTRRDSERWIRIDEVTRALLDVRFEVSEHEGKIALRGERDIGSEARLLLGKPSPFLGRDRELRHLLEMVEDGLSDRCSCAVLVTGPAGMGKSRLRYECVRKLQATAPDIVVSIGRGESIGAGSAFTMLVSALRGLLGISTGESAEKQRRKLSAYVDLYVDEKERLRVASFLGEMIGAHFSDEDDPRLRAARQDASIMASRIENAYVDFIRAVTNASPMLLVLEDLHWGDAPSIRLVNAVLRELHEQPFVVIAFARPEIHSSFPDLWKERGVQEIRLLPLSRRAAETLVRGVLGASCDAMTVATIIERAEGNAFYLEELVRAFVEGRGGLLPETVLGMVEARLAALSAEARKVLRAASIFGETFWERGVLALVGEEDGSIVRKILRDLSDREVIVAHAESRLLGETQHAFRHALVCDGAYAMLTDGDRAFGHEVAAEWLVQAGEQDPMVLAAHFERGGVLSRAAEYYAQAAEQASRGMDLDAAIVRAEKGLACGPEPDMVVALNTALSFGYLLNANYQKSYEYSMAALAVVGVESMNSGVLLGVAITSALFGGKSEAFGSLIPRLLGIELTRDGAAAAAQAFSIICITMLLGGKQAEVVVCFRRLEQIQAANPQDLLVSAHSELAKIIWLLEVDHDIWQSRESNRLALAGFESAGARQYVPITMAQFGWAHALLGLVDDASEIFDRILAGMDSGNLAVIHSLCYKSLLAMQVGETKQAREIAEKSSQLAATSGSHVISWTARLVVIECLIISEQFGEAEHALDALSAIVVNIPYLHARHLSLLALLRQKQGQLDEAVRLSAEAIVPWRLGPRYNYGEDPILLRHAEALRAQGDIDGSRRVIQEARDDLLMRASKIPDLEVRRSFLDNIPHRRRTLELAREWLDGCDQPR